MITVSRVLAMLTGLAIGVCAAQEHTGTPRVDSAFVRQAWAYDLACTGLTPQPGGELADVVWIVLPPGTLYIDHNSHALGLWVAPDTILIEQEATDVRWIVEHELLHHLLRGPPADQGGPHPWAPFAWPCQLMGFQHAVGGIMGNERGER